MLVLDWWVLIGLGLVLLVALPIVSFVSALADVFNRLDFDAPDSARIRAIGDAQTTWLLLPGTAYLLAIGTNVGTSFILDDDERTVQRGSFVLVAGAALIVILSVVAMSRASKRRGELADIRSWPSLLSEVNSVAGRSTTRPPQSWFLQVAEKVRELEASPTRLHRRGLAALQVGVGLAGWKKRPKVLEMIPWRKWQWVGVLRWIRVEPSPHIVLVSQVAAVVLAWYWVVEGAAPDAAITFTLFYLLADVLYLTGARLRMTSAARIAMRNEEYRKSIATTLTALRQLNDETSPPTAPASQSTERLVWIARVIRDVRSVVRT